MPFSGRLASVGRILVVRRGGPRRRAGDGLDGALAFLRQHATDLRSRIAVHETGRDERPELGGARAVVFFLPDPLAEIDPACYREATAIARRARERGLPALNGPDRLSNTLKGRQAQLWENAGLPTPPGRRVRDRRTLRSVARACGLPLVLRHEIPDPPRSPELIRSDEQLEACDPGGAWLVASPLVDVRSTYREADDGWRGRVHHPELWPRYHHVKRAHVIGDRVVPFRLLFAEEPAVSLANSLFGPWRGWVGGLGRIPWPLTTLAPRNPAIAAAIEEEKSYVHREEVAGADVLRRAVAALGLDHVAVDYATRADGQVVLWDARAHPAPPTPAHHPLWRERAMAERRERLYRALARLFRRLLTDEAEGSGGRSA